MKSAGVLIYNYFKNELKVVLVHPGGPYWSNKQLDGWGIPKGGVEENETIWEAAIREAEEELGQLPVGDVKYYLGQVRQNSKKTVHCFAIKGYINLPIKGMDIEIEWPKGSGNIVIAPEISEAKWFSPESAKLVMVKKQYEFIERLIENEMKLSPREVSILALLAQKAETETVNWKELGLSKAGERLAKTLISNYSAQGAAAEILGEKIKGNHSVSKKVSTKD